MRFQKDDGTFGGTGWLIDKETVVTAAHCLYDPKYDTFATTVDVFVGISMQWSQDKTEQEQRRASSVAVHWGYYAGYGTPYDFAILKLDQPFKDIVAVSAGNCPKDVDFKIRVVGFPGDLPSGHWRQGLDMYFSECKTPVYRLGGTRKTL